MNLLSGSMEHLLERMLLDPSAKPTNLPLSLLMAITNDFSDHRKIGSGGFANVYKGELQNGTVIAVKKLFHNLDMDEKKFVKEVGCFMKSKHKNVVRFLGYCYDTQGKMLNYEGKMILAEERQRLLCFEFLPKGSLDKYITDISQGLEWTTRYKIIKGICEGLHYLHQDMHMVHSDLKPANILLDDNMVPKIADFGLTRCFDGKQSKTITSKVMGSLGYLAPESYDGVITFKSDIYSFGIITMEILTGRKGYCDFQNVLQSWSIRFKKSSQKDIWLQYVRVCAEIGRQCIDHNPADRPHTLYIIERLDQMERTCGSIETDIHASSATQVSVIMAQIAFTRKDFGEEERALNRAHADRTHSGLRPPDAKLFPATVSANELNEMAEEAKRRAEIARLKEFNTLKGHVESLVKFKGVDIDTIQQSYSV